MRRIIALAGLAICLSPALAQPEKALTLEQAVQLALQQNPASVKASQDTKIARIKISQARSALGPLSQLTLTSTFVQNIPSIKVPAQEGQPAQTISITPHRVTNLNVTISQGIFTGSLLAQLSQAKGGYQAAAIERERVHQQLAFNVEAAYAAVLEAQQAVKVAQDTLAAAREHLRVASAHFQAGTAPQFDVLRADAQVASFELALTRANNGEDVARAALNTAMGVDVSEQLLLTSPLLREVSLPAFEDLRALALKQRPEMRQLPAFRKQGRAGVRLAQSGRLPTVAVQAIYQRQSPTTAFQVPGWTLVAGATMVLDDFGRAHQQAREARTRLAEVDTQQQQLVNNISLEVRQADLDVNAARQQIGTAERGVAQAEEAHRVAVVRYQAGVGTEVEIADAQAALAQALNDRNTALLTYNVSLARLKLAVGGALPAKT